MVIASGVMDQRRLSPFALPSSGSSSSFFSEELRIPERQSLGFWKPDSLSDQKGSKSFFSSPLEKLCLTGGVENPGAPTFKGQKDMFTLDNNLMGQEKTSSLPSTSWGDVHTSYASELSLSIKESTFVEPASVDQQVPNYEMGIFSSSFSEMFPRKFRSTSGGVIGQSVDTNNSSCEQVEPLGSMEEIEAQTIGDLLPDNDDLLSGVIDDFEYTGISTNCDDAEEDIFYTGGGMELDNGSLVESTKIPEGFLSDQLSRKHPSSDVSCQKIKLDYSHSGGTRYCLTQQCPIELKQEEHSGLLQQTNNSLPGGIGKLAWKNQESSSVHGLYYPVSSVMDKSLHGVYSSVTQKLSSPIRIGSMHQHNNQGSAAELSESIGEQNLGRGMQVVLPRSLPEYQNGASNNSKSITLSGMNSSRLAGMDCSHLHKTGTSDLHGHSLDPNKACGFSGIGSCPLHGHHYLWNTSNAFPQNPSTPMLWPSLQHPVHMHGFPQVPSHMLTTGVFPIDQHHLGSASSYGGSCADIHSFHPGSLGSVGFLGSPQLYPSELTVFPHTRGNCGEPMFSPVSIGFPSPQQRCHVFNGRNPMINFSTSYDAPNDRIRSRRHDGNGNQSDNKKQFELDIDHIINGEDSRTTLMIKNIPNKYTCKMLLAVIDEDHQGAYDFIYLPIDFKNKCNVGYAFVNMTDPKHIVPFFKTFNGKRWEKFNSEKVASLAYARIQGRCALIAHFQNSSLMNEDKRCRPMLFHKDGPNAGDQEPFPVGNNVRSRSGRNRTFNNPDLQQQSPSTLPNQATSGGGNSPSGSTEDPLE